MVFSLVKQWLGPVFGTLATSMRSSQKLPTENTPRDIRTFGGGGSKPSWRGRGPPSAYPITSVTLNESEERIVMDIKMQDAKSWASDEPAAECTSQPRTRSNSMTRSASTLAVRTGDLEHGHGNIRKDVEVAVTSEPRELQLDANGNTKSLSPENFSFAKGPKRNSKRGPAFRTS